MIGRPALDPVVRELAAHLRPGTGPTGDPAVGWAALLALADEHRLLPALWSSLAARGVRPLPAGLAGGAPDRAPLAVLERAHRENAARVADLREQLDLVLDALDTEGIDAVPIKGAHHLLAGWLPDPAARVMVDVDVLVPAGRADAAVGALAGLGYRPAGPAPDALTSGHQLQALAHPGRAGSVELHVEPIIGFHRSLLTAEEVFADAVSVEVSTARRRVPSDTHAMVVLAGHAQLHDEGALLLHLPLRALWDVAVLDGVVRADWEAVAGHFARDGRRSSLALAGFAVAAHDLFGVDLDVPARGGSAWLRAVGLAERHPGAADAYRRAVYLPRSLRRERMAHLYGATGGLTLQVARARHLVRGAHLGPAGQRRSDSR